MRKPLKKVTGNLLFANRFIRNAHAVHVLNEAEAASVRMRFPRSNIFVVPHGVPNGLSAKADSFNRSAGRKSPNSPLVVGFIGRIDVDNKGLDVLIEALKVLEQRGSSANIQSMIVGPFWTNKDESRLRALLAGLKDPSKVRLIGAVSGDKKWEVLSGFDVFIYTSRHEGMPGSVIEAMVFGKPCIVTPGTNMQGVISECQGGWAVDLSSGAIADTLLSLDKDRSDIVRRGLNARKYVYENLLWSKISAEYCQKVTGLLSNG